ncbi:hypothetical protein IMSHALPRED_010346 [Imshaugia aleurites]|uniref:RING-type domain-containing protein n=1 Tax=Imshaugia aleurites TaxID=172621 RepID=A0A8H3G385_9LECA|nr:hypothetical protein IMSHALPRED_010346 [Imshaugia aleurites]
MSFGWSGSDVFLLAQLAWNTVQNARKACGEYDGLTRETMRLHAMLQRLKQEVAKSDSPVNRPGDTSKEQLECIASDCEVVLKLLDKMVAGYVALSEEKRSTRKIWQKIRFSNGQMADLGDLRSKVILYTSEMLFYVNLISMGTVGRIEQQMNRDGGVLKDIKIAVEKKTAHSVLSGPDTECSILTKYADDDAGFWRGLRRELVREGLPSVVIHKHKHLIKAYVKELGARGVLDDSYSGEKDEEHGSDASSGMSEETHELSNSPNVDLAAGQEVRDESNDQDSVVQTLEDDEGQMPGSKNRESTEVKTEGRPPRTDATASISERSKGRSSTKPDSSSSLELPRQASRPRPVVYHDISDTGDTEYDFKTKEDWSGPQTPAPPIATHEDPKSYSSPERVQCTTCLSDDVPISETALLPCKHRWCNSCLRQKFILSTIEYQHMPPKSLKTLLISNIPKSFSTTVSREDGIANAKNLLPKTAFTAPEGVVAHGSNLSTSTSNPAAAPTKAGSTVNAKTLTITE